MKPTMIALTALAVLSSFNTSAEDQSHAFNDAVSTLHRLQNEEKDNLKNFNETVSRDGTGRFNADGDFNYALAEKSDQISAARRDAQKEVNGTTYRNQVQQQQDNAEGAARIKMNQQRTRQQVIAGGVAEVSAQIQQQKAAAFAADLANKAAQRNERVSHDDRLLDAMTHQPMATQTPAVTIGVKTPVQTVPSVILNKPVSVSHVTFATSKGNAGSKGGHASHGGSDNRGGDNAHSAAFGGHGYGHDNSRSEGFGGHSHFH